MYKQLPNPLDKHFIFVKSIKIYIFSFFLVFEGVLGADNESVVDILERLDTLERPVPVKSCCTQIIVQR